MTDTNVWFALVCVVGIILLSLVIAINGTDWIALSHGYCQSGRAGSVTTLWTKCEMVK